MFELFFWIFLGLLIGSVTGLVPGIHSNNLVVLIFLFSIFPAFNVSVLIISAALMHSFADVIPSILFAAPEEETIFSLLIGHKFFLKGKAIQAIQLTLIGSFFTGVTSLIIAPVFFLFLTRIESILSTIIPWVLILIVLLMIFEKNNFNFIKSNFLIITLTGFLGLVSLNNNEFNLMIGITGLFAGGNLVFSLLNKPIIKKQVLEPIKIDFLESIKWSFVSSVFACFTALLPGLTSGQSTLIASKIINLNEKNYLVFIGGINTATQLMSLIVLFTLNKARTGTAIGIQKLIELTTNQLIQLLIISLIILGLAFIITEFLAFETIKLIQKINYSKINLTILTTLLFSSAILNGLNGLILFLTATSIGVLTNTLGVKKTNLMGYLLIPTILIYLGF